MFCHTKICNDGTFALAKTVTTFVHCTTHLSHSHAIIEKKMCMVKNQFFRLTWLQNGKGRFFRHSFSTITDKSNQEQGNYFKYIICIFSQRYYFISLTSFFVPEQSPDISMKKSVIFAFLRLLQPISKCPNISTEQINHFTRRFEHFHQRN